MDWRAYPTWWIRSAVLKELGAVQLTTGTHIAALKVYLALAIAATFETYEAEVSLTQLQVITGLSRPMVTAGIRKLEQIGALHVDRTAHRNRYTLVQKDGETHWMKIPAYAVRLQLKNLPNSGATALAALKIYLTLLTVRQRKSHEAPISHRGLQRYTGIRPALISRGVAHLIEVGLVRFAPKPTFQDAAGHPVNTYYLIGRFSEGTDSVEDKEIGRGFEGSDGAGVRGSEP